LIVVVTLTTRFTRRTVKKETILSLGRMLAAFIIILLVLITVDKLTHAYPPDREATLFMLTGHFAWIFWGLQIGLGVVVPLAILFNPRLNKVVRNVALAGGAVVVGVFFERYYLVIVGASFPMPYYPGDIQGVWGALGSFAITPAEMTLSVGILAAVALIYVLGLKYLELLPVNDAAEVPKEKP